MLSINGELASLILYLTAIQIDMMNPRHHEILSLIQKHSGTPTHHTFNDSYLGNSHPRYPINNPTMRKIAREWMQSHKELKSGELEDVLTSLIEGESCTEKMMAGIMLGYASKSQRNLEPMIFDRWLDHLIGWVEVDTLCTGNFLKADFPGKWPAWKALVEKLSRDPNINKRRASLVMFCSPLGHKQHDEMAKIALEIVDRLKSEKDVLITKAISWVLRTMLKLHREKVSSYLKEKGQTLPKIALRETIAKLETGRKTNGKL
jgi:3-methyladenine DNA glycosylase AlkD